MERWQNKVAVVTGASSGIGAATAADLAKAGFIVVALARRENRLWENRRALPKNLQSHYHPLKCDVTKEEEVKNAFLWIEENLGGTDVLINNAGVIRGGLHLSNPANMDDVRQVVDVNVMAVAYCVSEAFESMKKRDVEGHIIIVNSVTGHSVPTTSAYPINIYPATKHAVTAMTETYRQEFANLGTKVKISSISPGAVDTEMEAVPDEVKASLALLKSEDISDAILYMLGTPPHVQIHEMIIKPLFEMF